MPAPSSTLTTLRPEIGSMMEFDLEADRNGFIGLRVFPAFDVMTPTDVFGVIPLEALLQQRKTKRAPSAGYSRGDYEFSERSYICDEHGAEEPIDHRLERMYRDFFDLEVVAAKRARDVVMRNHEIRVAAKLFDSSTYTPTAAEIAWSTHATAKPLDDVEARVQSLYDKGIDANALVVGWKAFRDLRRCDQIQNEINSSGAGDRTQVNDITAQKLAEVFDLKYVIVGGARKNTKKQGQNASLSQIWDTGLASVCRIAETNDISEPAFGRTFHWTADGSEIGGLVESYEEGPTRSTIIRCRFDTDERVIYSECNELIDITP